MGDLAKLDGEPLRWRICQPMSGQDLNTTNRPSAALRIEHWRHRSAASGPLPSCADHAFHTLVRLVLRLAFAEGRETKAAETAVSDFLEGRPFGMIISVLG